MKIITYESGRVTWLFPVEEFAPLGGILAQQLVIAIKERYNFERIPSSLVAEAVSKNGLKFESGIFQHDGQLINIVEFTAFSDGFVAVTNLTERSEAFLADLVTWLQETFKFRPISTPIQRINLSTLAVEFDAPLSAALKPNLGLEGLVAGEFKKISGSDVKVVLGRMDFLVERPMSERALPIILPRLVLDLRAGTVPEQQRYYSSAPLTTFDHIAALGAIEAKLSGG
ncbi:hypothetical protein V5279_25200 [Bradyrhizobium sp. 26S5]|uniref:hypothetical protein n=1 Tax=Bradyrhizobium sp. 26S5 TaxID=3139729 RepID=UPI0030D21A76